MERPLRLTWIVPSANLSGGTKSNRLIAEAMVRRGHRVTIAYSTASKPWPKPWRIRAFAQRYARHLMNVLRPPSHHLENSTASLLAIPSRPIVNDQVPDADFVFATWWETREWIESWPPCKGRKVYFVRHHELHGGDPERVKVTYQLSGQKFVIAKWLQQVMADDYGDSTSILIPNGVDKQQFDSPPRSRQAVPTVGFMYGRGWKGGEMAIQALRIVQREIPRLRVIVITRNARDRHKNFPKCFDVYYRPSQETIPQLYAKTDCWLLPSTTEGFGMPGIEAAACRCPVVATRCGGPEDYVIDGVTGFLVPVNEPKAMAEAICRTLGLSDEAWQHMSDASYNLARQFDWDTSAELLETALYEQLAGESVEHPAPISNSSGDDF